MMRHEPHMPAATPGGMRHRYPTYPDMRKCFVLLHIRGGKMTDDEAKYFVGDGTITLDEYQKAKAEFNAIESS